MHFGPISKPVSLAPDVVPDNVLSAAYASGSSCVCVDHSVGQNGAKGGVSVGSSSNQTLEAWCCPGGIHPLQPHDGGSNAAGAVHAQAKCDDDDDSHWHASNPAAASVAAERQSDRCKLECIRLRQQIDAQRLKIDAHAVNSADSETEGGTRAPLARTYSAAYQQQAAAAAEVAATAAKTSHKMYPEELKQKRAAAIWARVHEVGIKHV
eukprot:5234316-Pleurochrysis_carterae.AAC.2